MACDTEVLTAILLGHATCVQRTAASPGREQAVPVLVIEEMMRGRLHVIRPAEAGRATVSLARAYELCEETVRDVRRFPIRSHTPQAEALSQPWRQQGVRLATHDLRMAATCGAHAATLIARKRRDFERVPGLIVEFWE